MVKEYGQEADGLHRIDRMPEVCLPQDCPSNRQKTAGPSRGSQMRMKWASECSHCIHIEGLQAELCLLRTEKMSMLIEFPRVFVCLFLSEGIFFFFCFRNTY